MAEPYIIAEAAQGYEGSVDVARLLIRAAAAAGADAIKFQIVYADDLAVPGYKFYDLFRSLEMPLEAWSRIRAFAAEKGLAFYGDVLGPRSAEVAATLSMDGVKIHSTCFFEDELIARILAGPGRVLLSLGGIEEDEIKGLSARHPLGGRAMVMYGFQAEPTPLELNNLARIPALRRELGLEIGFMDHVDGGGPDVVTLSAMALGLGVSCFEKHITLDRALAMEDFDSALSPTGFADYVKALRRLAPAMGDGSLALSEEEQAYRQRALKRVVAARPLAAGTVLAAGDLALLRPAEPVAEAMFRPGDALGRRLSRDLALHAPITPEVLS